MKKSSHLSLLLDYMHISAVDLADAIHVDPSLISRWRTKSRQFNRMSTYYSDVIEFVLERDKPLSYQNIFFFLENNKVAIEKKDRDGAYKAIDLWLSAPHYDRDSTSVNLNTDSDSFASVGIIKGNAMKKKSIMSLLETALSLDDPKQLFLMFDSRTDSYFEEDNFYKTWINHLHMLTDKGVEITFIYNNDIFHSNIVNLENFVSLCCKPNFHVYFTSKNFISFFDLCILEDTIALTNFVGSSSSEKETIFSFNHPVLLNTFQNEYKYHLSKCSQVFIGNDILKKNHVILNTLKYSDSRIIFYSSTLLYFPVSIALFKKILSYNNLTPKEYNEALENYQSFCYNPLLRESTDNILIYCIDDNENTMAEPYFDYYPRILLNGSKKITLPQTLYKEVLEEIKEYAADPEGSPLNISLEIALASSSSMPQNVAICNSENNCTYIHSFPSLDKSKAIFSSNQMFSTDIANYLDKSISKLSAGSNHLDILLHIIKSYEENIFL